MTFPIVLEIHGNLHMDAHTLALAAVTVALAERSLLGVAKGAASLPLQRPVRVVRQHPLSLWGD